MDAYIGMITPFPYAYAPRDWVDCDGRTLPIQSHAALFSLIGTTFGGDGRNNFAVPDLRGRVPIGIGTSPLGRYELGKIQGQNSKQLLSNRLVIPSQRPEETNPQPTAVVANTAWDPINVQNPSLAMRWCICVQGIYPFRPD